MIFNWKLNINEKTKSILALPRSLDTLNTPICHVAYALFEKHVTSPRASSNNSYNFCNKK